jgi:hypothetical protein
VRAHLQRWGVVYVLAVIWLGFWLVHLLLFAAEYAQEQQDHGRLIETAEMVTAWLAASFENLTSEAWQLLFQAGVVVGAAHLLFKRGEDQTDRIEAKLDRLLGERQ